MAQATFGSVLLIANPYSQNGKCEQIAQNIFRWLQETPSWTSKVDLALTDSPGHAQEHAEKSATYDTVVALGGDGLVHEVINGLMSLEEKKRPLLCIAPVGSGNDFAMTLGLTINNAQQALEEAVFAPTALIDLGKVNDHYFMETLSFGLDAAIAIDTIERRKETGKSGMALYLDSGLRIFSKKQDGYHFNAILDHEREIEGVEVCFAVQNGATFGGGFKICPAANPKDGKLDLCYTYDAPGRLNAIKLIMRARNGNHVSSSIVGITTFKHMHVTFDPIPPVQIDGEKLEQAKTFDIEIVPSALRVVVGSQFFEKYSR